MFPYHPNILYRAVLKAGAPDNPIDVRANRFGYSIYGGDWYMEMLKPYILELMFMGGFLRYTISSGFCFGTAWFNSNEIDGCDRCGEIDREHNANLSVICIAAVAFSYYLYEDA